MSFLRYTEGAIPGIKNKRKASEEERKSKNKKYEEGRTRTFNNKWKIGRPWLHHDATRNVMTCNICVQQLQDTINNKNLRGQNKFITGCSNFKISTVVDHETSLSHIKCTDIFKASTSTSSEVQSSKASTTLLSLKKAQRDKLKVLIRNAHAVLMHNRPITDFVWLCNLDQVKGVNLGETYLNNKAALGFIKAIAATERDKTVDMLNDVNFFSFMMDGSTDISGDEQEALYLRFSMKGKITERFIGIGSPQSTCASDLMEFTLKMFSDCRIDKGKLVGLGSDGASNMVGRKGGLAALLRENINNEIINVHCFAHRLELAFRDVLKKNKLYEKLMSLLIGLYYFYGKSYNNKKALLECFSVVGEGVLPTKVTGTRWLPHLSRGIQSFLKTFKAYEAQLSTASHKNPKAEGLCKLMLGKDLLAFILFLKEVLDPLMKLSLKLQKPEASLADCYLWVESTIELLHEYKSREIESLTEMIRSGTFKEIKLKGAAPKMAYKEGVIDGFIQAIRQRFDLDAEELDVFKCTHILHLKNWPTADSVELQDFAVEEVKKTSAHFIETLTKVYPEFNTDELLKELEFMKKVMYKRHGEKLQSLSWSDLYDPDFPRMMMIIELLNCVPPTSVRCETTFSQMKLVKTSRRTKLKSETLNDILLVKLESHAVTNFDPSSAVDKWLSSPLKPRLLNYKRRNQQAEPILVEADSHLDDHVDNVNDVDHEDQAMDQDAVIDPNATITNADEADLDGTGSSSTEQSMDVIDATDIEVQETQQEESVDSDTDTDSAALNEIFSGKEDENDEYCENFLSESDNWALVFDFARD